MQYRRLGNSELELSTIGLGSWLTYGGSVGQQTAKECIDQAFSAGINFIDTANIYDKGNAETILGELLQDRPRDSYVLATKLFFPMDSENKGLSAKQIKKQSEDSLKRLKTDYFDLYQCHRWDSETPLEETMTALSELVDSGKARYIGFSEWTAEQIQAAADISNVTNFVSSQPEYSILQRRIEADVIPLCEKLEIGQVVWSPLAQGLLTGKYKPGQALPQDSRAANKEVGAYMGDWLENPKRLEAVQKLAPIAQEQGITMAQMALAWVLRQENVTSAITGASKPSQITENVAAADITLSNETLYKIDEAVESVASYQ